MVTTSIPQGWCVSKISDISIKCEQRKPEVQETFFYVDIGSINRELKVIESPQQIMGKDAPSRARKVINSGDVLVSLTRPNLNAVALVPEELNNQIASTGFEVIKSIFVDSRYVFALARSKDFIDKISGAVQGALYPAAKSSDVQSFEFLLPPLAEQKAIADKLDRLLAQVETTKARLERIPDILKRFRQSVLAAAVSGKLTEEWRNGQNFLTKNGFVGDFVCIDIGHAFKSKEFSEVGIKLLRGQNIAPGSLKWLDTKYFPEEKIKEFSDLFINTGDIVLAMDRPIISSGLKLARAKIEDLPCVLVQRVARFKNFDGLTPDFLYLLLSDTGFTNYIQPNQTGSDIPHISGKQILSYKVKTPSIEEQTEIVRRVEQLFTYADTIEQKAQAALERVNNLTQSILAKAFRGELTAQWREENPDLITGENSAEALLAKIKAEREAMKPVKKSRAKT